MAISGLSDPGMYSAAFPQALVGAAALKKSMNMQQVQAATLLQGMQESSRAIQHTSYPSHLGTIIDAKA